MRGGDLTQVQAVFDAHISHSYASLRSHLGDAESDPFDLEVD